ncbi:hypothetical protein LguiA_003164 [Lonicera macranthoides]
MAGKRGKTAIMNRLLDVNQDTCLLQHKNENTPLHVAANIRQIEVATLLIGQLSQQQLVQGEIKHTANVQKYVIRCGFHTLQQFIEADSNFLTGVMISNIAHYFTLLLSCAVRMGKTAVVNRLLNLNQETCLLQDNNENTPLHVAANSSHIEVVTLLIGQLSQQQLVQGEIKHIANQQKCMIRCGSHALQQFIEAGSNFLDVCDDKYHSSLLHTATELRSKDRSEPVLTILVIFGKRINKVTMIITMHIFVPGFYWPNGLTHYNPFYLRPNPFSPVMLAGLNLEVDRILEIARVITYVNLTKVIKESVLSMARDGDTSPAQLLNAQQGRQSTYKVGFLQQCEKEIVYKFEYLQANGSSLLKTTFSAVDSDLHIIDSKMKFNKVSNIFDKCGTW